jgi:hypothetical protein
MDEQQAAEYLKVTPRCIRDWRARLGLPCYKPTCKIVIYRRTDLDAWLERSRLVLAPRSRRVMC